MVIHEQSRGRKNFMSNLRLLKKPDKKIQDALDEPESSASLLSFFGSSVLKVRTEVLVSETKPAGFAKGQGSQRELLKKPLKELLKKAPKKTSKKSLEERFKKVVRSRMAFDVLSLRLLKMVTTIRCPLYSF